MKGRRVRIRMGRNHCAAKGMLYAQCESRIAVVLRRADARSSVKRTLAVVHVDKMWQSYELTYDQ
jgi:hypothetical protein